MNTFGLLGRGDNTTAKRASVGGKNKEAADMPSGPLCQRFEEDLLVVISRALGKDSAIGHGDLGLSDSVGFRLLGAYSGDFNFVPDL